MKRGRSLRLFGAAGLTLGALSAAGITASSLLLTATPAAAATNPCTSVPSIGLTAEVVATNGQTITSAGGNIDATGCDIGIYVGPGINGVTIGGTPASNGMTISGANDTGIFAEDNSSLTVQNNTIQGNGVAPGRGSFRTVALCWPERTRPRWIPTPSPTTVAAASSSTTTVRSTREPPRREPER